MFEDIKRAIIKGGMTLDRYELIALAGGNLSVRMPSGEILITPSGMIYEDLVEDDILVMNLDGTIIEGTRKPSSDTEGILYIFRNMPEVNAVIHTHQPYATAIGLIEDEFECNLTTLANACKGAVKVAPYSSPASEDMGKDVVNYIGDSLAVILAHHGIMTVGKDLKQALCAAVYLEESAKCYLAARACTNEMKHMTPAQIAQSVEVFNFCGQGTPDVPKDLVKKVK